MSELTNEQGKEVHIVYFESIDVGYFRTAKEASDEVQRLRHLFQGASVYHAPRVTGLPAAIWCKVQVYEDMKIKSVEYSVVRATEEKGKDVVVFEDEINMFTVYVRGKNFKEAIEVTLKTLEERKKQVGWKR